MGKLHTLKRAVERHPEKFMVDYRLAHMGIIAEGAIFRDGQWEPIVCDRERSRLFPYRKFVRSVLKQMGYDVR